MLCIGCVFGLMSCKLRVRANCLSEDYAPRKVSVAPTTDRQMLASYAFALSLICQTAKEENTLLSPLSVMLALAMTANGANGETKAQMEKALGMPIEQLNGFLYAMLQNTDQEVLGIAQSIWFRENAIHVSPAFLQTNADYFGADAYAAPFDQTTLKDINKWVDYHTDGMIKELLDSINSAAVMYLISALAFDAKWERAYPSSAIQNADFFHLDGSMETVQMMHSTESLYLTNGEAQGFMKYYEGGRYAYMGILPPEHTSPDDYLASLTPEALFTLLTTPQHVAVNAGTPAYSFSDHHNLNDALKAMGITDAFHPTLADFTGIDTAGGLSIDEVIHKTFIDVNADGTRAAAVTSVGVKTTSAEPTETVTVVLNRPFIVVLFDTYTNLPLFVGTVYTID